MTNISKNKTVFSERSKKQMMTPFPFDDFRKIFISEVKDTFMQFMEANKKRKPYIFSISVPDYIALNHPQSYCISFNGNTIEELQSNGYSFNSNNPDDLYYKYTMDEWDEHSPLPNAFPKSNEIILNYISFNENHISDEKCRYTEAFLGFRNEFFEYLISTLEQLKNENYFASIAEDKILINFEVREYYDENQMCQIFGRLNDEKDLTQFEKWL